MLRKTHRSGCLDQRSGDQHVQQ